MSKRTELKSPPRTMPKDFSLKHAIHSEYQLYKANAQRRDKKVRQYFEESTNKISVNKSKLKIGSLYMFQYFQPKLEEELEYYDAMPCVIFFGRCKTKEGEPRVLGFNLHYYPPRIRYLVLDRIMEIFKPFYKNSWGKTDPRDMEYFTYMMLVFQLQKAKLDFGVHMYIPDLISNAQLIEPKDWQKAVFTEGRFKKRTRNAILNYWKNKQIDRALINRASKQGSVPHI